MKNHTNGAHLSLGREIVFPSIEAPFDGRGFFLQENSQNITGVFLNGDSFERQILTVVKPLTFVESLACTSFDIIKPGNDEEIRGELPDGHVFKDASIFCAHFAKMIGRQPGGAKGALIADGGYFNQFYVQGVEGEVFLVNIDRDNGPLAAWYLSSRKMDPRASRSARRVFSAM